MIDKFLETNQRVSIYICSKAGWPEFLINGEKTGEEMAKFANISISRARRLIRACMTADVFREITAGLSVPDEHRRYVSTPMSDVLRADHPFSVKDFLNHEIEDIAPALLSLAKEWNREERIPFASAHSEPNTHDAVWKYFQNRPLQQQQFNRAMTNLDSLGVPALAQDYPWAANCRAIIDVGGGRGSLLAAVLAAAPAAKGALLDLPQVIDQSEKLWTAKYPELLPRVSFHRGSFFEASAIPTGDDSDAGPGRRCYMSKVVLHDWDDAKAEAIIANVAAAMRPGDRYLIPEFILQEPELMTSRTMCDIQMMTIAGKERTVADLSALMRRAGGLSLVASHPTRSLYSVAEFEKS